MPTQSCLPGCSMSRQRLPWRRQYASVGLPMRKADSTTDDTAVSDDEYE